MRGGTSRGSHSCRAPPHNSAATSAKSGSRASPRCEPQRLVEAALHLEGSTLVIGEARSTWRTSAVSSWSQVPARPGPAWRPRSNRSSVPVGSKPSRSPAGYVPADCSAPRAVSICHAARPAGVNEPTAAGVPPGPRRSCVCSPGWGKGGKGTGAFCGDIKGRSGKVPVPFSRRDGARGSLPVPDLRGGLGLAAGAGRGSDAGRQAGLVTRHSCAAAPTSNNSTRSANSLAASRAEAWPWAAAAAASPR